MSRARTAGQVGLLLALALLSLSLGCRRSGTDSVPTRLSDLPEIRRQGVLRVIVPAPELGGALPREGWPLGLERQLIEEYAEREGLRAAWVHVPSRRELIPSLLEGRGDIVVANLTATAERRRKVQFTVPLRFVREQLVTRAGDATLTGPADLEGRQVSVRPSSSFWATLERLRERYPGIRVEAAPENVDTEELIHQVAKRQLDVTVADNDLVESVLGYRKDIRAAFDLTDDEPIAWAVRPGSPELLRGVNRFLTETQLVAPHRELRTGDLPEIRSQRTLRVLTRNSPSTYFLWRGELMGFEYELLREFARRQGLRIEVRVPPPGEDLLEWLVEGRGDVVAATLTPGAVRTPPGVIYTGAYNFVSPMVVARTADQGLAGPEGLAGRTLFVQRSSVSWNELERLQLGGVPLALQPAPEELAAEELIALVGNGRYDLAVVGSDVLAMELGWRADVRGAFAVGGPAPRAWAVRESNPELRAAIDAFLALEYRGRLYNLIYGKYFEGPRRLAPYSPHELALNGALSPYDDLVRRYAEQYDFDWRLIVAMMYEESRFDPDAQSFAGAVGLLQVLPDTGREMGFEDLRDPETNIRAGLKYLDWLRDRFPEDLSAADRVWLALASYNVGPEHVRDARRLAAEKGWDPDRWFGHVERAMQLLSRTDIAQDSPYGYCRGHAPVNYVREVHARYEAYRQVGPVVRATL